MNKKFLFLIISLISINSLKGSKGNWGIYSIDSYKTYENKYGNFGEAIEELTVKIYKNAWHTNKFGTLKLRCNTTTQKFEAVFVNDNHELFQLKEANAKNFYEMAKNFIEKQNKKKNN